MHGRYVDVYDVVVKTETIVYPSVMDFYKLGQDAAIYSLGLKTAADAWEDMPRWVHDVEGAMGGGSLGGLAGILAGAHPRLKAYLPALMGGGALAGGIGGVALNRHLMPESRGKDFRRYMANL